MVKYIEFLNKNSIKVTPQRLAIIELIDKHGHISIKEIYSEIRSNFPSLSLATIYKNINTMLDGDFIKELKIVGKESKYELTKDDHSHLICKECGDVEDIDIKTEDIILEARKNSNYDITDSTIQFFGLCPSCR